MLQHYCNKQDNPPKRNKGFTLVELSIVIVIIGLIISGILGGSAIVEQTRLRSVITDFNKIHMAVNTFKLEFNALPGDMVDASEYWGTNCDASPSNCNGNGNGFIGTDNGHNESIRAYQHMALANIITGQYSGSGTRCNGPEFCMLSRYRDGTFYIKYDICEVSHGCIASGVELGNIIRFIAVSNSSNSSPILTPLEAFGLDRKFDDGNPQRGVYWATHDDCTDGSYPNRVYEQHDNAAECYFTRINAF